MMQYGKFVNCNKIGKFNPISVDTDLLKFPKQDKYSWHILITILQFALVSMRTFLVPAGGNLKVTALIIPSLVLSSSAVLTP